MSFNLIALLFLAHGFIPKARTHTRKFFHLSYYNPDTTNYGIGFDDGYLIAFCIVLFTGLRAGTMEYVLAPFAKTYGISKRKDLTRFSEQAWLFLYYVVFWTLGVVSFPAPTIPNEARLTQAQVPLCHLAVLHEHARAVDCLARP